MKNSHIFMAIILALLTFAGLFGTADAFTYCDNLAKPALSCPTGYSVMCLPAGGYHWECGKELYGEVAEAYPETNVEIINTSSADVSIMPVSAESNIVLDSAFGIIGKPFILDGSKSQDDGVIRKYLWHQISGPMVILSNQNSLKPSFTPTVAGTYVFELTVADSSGLISVAQRTKIGIGSYDSTLKTTPPPPPPAGDPDFDLLKIAPYPMPPAPTKEMCLQKCGQLGAPGLPEFDACMKTCLNAGTLRNAACPGDVAPGCVQPTTPVCRDGKWICVGPATGAGTRKALPPQIMPFRPSTTTPLLINATEVRGWDPKRKEEFLTTVKEHAEIRSGQDLENFARGVLLRDENAETVEVNEEKVEMKYRMPAKFLGIFKSSLTARVEVDAENKVKVRYPWLHFFYSKPVSAGDIQAEVEKETGGVKQTMQTQVREGDDEKLDEIDLQEKMQRQSRMLEIMSNITKKMSDTASGIIQNMK